MKYGRIKRIEKITEKYGREILTDFYNVNKVQYFNLTSISKKYKFSREYARQIYNLIFKKPFRPSRSLKALDRRKDISCSKNPYHKVAEYKAGIILKGAKYEKIFMDICIEHGFKVTLPNSNAIDLVVNGKNVEVKACLKPKLARDSITRICHYNISKKQLQKADYFACYHPKEDTFFIIPNTFANKKSMGLYINEVKTNHYNSKNRHWEFKDAWDLLQA